MLRQASWLLAAALWIGACPVQAQDDTMAELGPQARSLAEWVLASGDAQGMPFAIVDKQAATLYLFDATQALITSTPVIVGQTVGDHTTPGVGQRTQLGRVGRDERTTPAGRFETKPGRNLQGEHVVWLDYDAAFAIHRVREGPRYEERLARLASASPRDNRDSLGCVVVPVDFYLKHVQEVFGRRAGVVYVLPESASQQVNVGPRTVRTSSSSSRINPLPRRSPV
ncbi:L,D-transpeptidase [Ramlibacter rhizophilus]|uniref:L,D-transpeptidase n=1 Tax=Ramlibacter rhizophilus TaxID=1781167 RepID=UPI00197CD660|nr:L,D-transpeptidase [Ramlibacter rhizophilus]